MADVLTADLHARIPYADFLGVDVTADGGTVMPFRDDLVGNPMLPAIHGGVLGSFLELTALFEAARQAPEAHLPEIINITVEYLRSGRPRETYGRAILTKQGRRVVNVSATAWQEDIDRPIAQAYCLFLLQPEPGLEGQETEAARDGARTSMTAMDAAEIERALRYQGLAGQPLMVHASWRSVGTSVTNPGAFVDGVLAAESTLVVPTFTYEFEIDTPRFARWPQNGMDYSVAHEPPPGAYDPLGNELSQYDMGVVPATVLGRPGRARGIHPLNSFTGVGPMAAALIGTQTLLDVYAPLKMLCEKDGYILLLGTRYDKLTLLHLAEEVAGKTLFRRWAAGTDGPVECAVGSCSAGFNRMASVLDPLRRIISLGDAPLWVLRAREVVRVAAAAIVDEPDITDCGRTHCLRCRDMNEGGPLLPDRHSRAG